MSAKLSISRVPGQKKRRPIFARIILLISLLAILVLIAGVLSFTRANQLMRQPAQPVAEISSNVMPVYQLASFPSLDEQTALSGWFFLAEGAPVSTIILVHDQGSNRLPFGLDSPRLFEHLTQRGFHVLAFDLRNSGRSEGELSGYGYSEWTDVLAAIRYVRRVSSTRDVLLYGIGTGVSASLIALDQLPLPDTDTMDLPRLLRELEFDRSYVRGLLLDTPAASPDDYIRPVVREQDLLGRYLLQYTVPYAVRLSAGSTRQTSLIGVLSRSQLPVFISSSEKDSRISPDDVQPLIRERLRLHPETTVVFTSQAEGTAAGFIAQQQEYLDALDQYFRRYFSR